MDPVSLTASILGFLDVASKIKATLDQVGANRKRLRELSANVVKGVVDIEDLLFTTSKDMDPRNAAKLREHVDALKLELELVHGRCSRSLQRRGTGPFSGATATVSQWFQRGEIDAMINGLEKQVHVCYLRCQVLLCGNIYSACSNIHSALLLHREEHRNNMERLERAFSRGIIANGEQEVSFIIGASGLSQVDWDYLLRQVQRVIEVYDRVKPDEFIGCTELSEYQLQEPLLHWGSSINIMFSACLKHSFHTFEILSSMHNHTFLLDCAQPLLDLGFQLYHLCDYDETETILEIAVSLYDILIAAHPTIQFQRRLAAGLLYLSCIQSSTTGHLSTSKRAVNACEYLYDLSGELHDMLLLVYALLSHCFHLNVNGSLDEALDLSQQSLVLTREYRLAAQDVQWSYPIACWTASGEADVVFSSSRQLSNYTYVALSEAQALWQLGSSWAATGHFAEAHIAGSDALSCLDAVLQVDPWYRDVIGWNAERWRVTFVTWVSIPRRPSQSGSTASIEEVDEEEGPSSSNISRPHLMGRSGVTA